MTAQDGHRGAPGAPEVSNSRPRPDPGAHPCFDPVARRSVARIHLPVAGRCNVQCNYCDRRSDCPHESRPGVASAVLRPAEALEYLAAVHARAANLGVVGIAGPGDPFATPQETLETLARVRARFPALRLCVATNGLGLLPHVDELAALGVSHVTVTVNAIDAGTGSRIYAWVRDGYRILRGTAAAALLLERQDAALRALAAAGILVKANTIVLPGVNDAQVSAIAAWLRERGVGLMNCVAHLPVAGTPFAALGETPAAMLAAARAGARRILPQMTHCARCRADACGLVGEGAAPPVDPREFTAAARRARTPRPGVAVATREGLLVNQHLGEAATVTVYHEGPGGFRPVDQRRLPPRGAGDERWSAVAAILHDCRALLVSGIGPRPRSVLEAAGLPVIEMEGLVEDGLAAVFGGREIPAPLQRHFGGCGTGCAGDGSGCG